LSSDVVHICVCLIIFFCCIFCSYSCKYGIPALRRAGGGSIINTASFVAKLGAATPQVKEITISKLTSI
jgi:hypothetical protein